MFLLFSKVIAKFLNNKIIAQKADIFAAWSAKICDFCGKKQPDPAYSCEEVKWSNQ
jgi:hypothetical protein